VEREFGLDGIKFGFSYDKFAFDKATSRNEYVDMSPRGTPPRACQPRAFTLIEILALIAIVGVLAALLFPMVGRVRESANQAKCVSNLRTLSAALLLAAGENNGILPLALDQSLPQDQRNWMNKVSATVGPWSTSVASGGQPNSSIFNCPTTKRKGTGTWPATSPCYGVNTSIMGIVYVGAGPDPSSSKSLAALNRLSTLALIGDVGGPNGIMDGDFRMNAEAFVASGFPAGMSTLPFQFPAPRHPPTRNGNYVAGAFNLAFCDGHVETIKATDPRLPTQELRKNLFVP
jgi:prepilin-type processing-associated H-X9-DG protein